MIDFDLIVILSCFFVTLMLVIFNQVLAEKINIYDFPDNERKFHTKKTALTGGIIIFISLLVFFLLKIIQNIFEGNFLIYNFKENLTLLVGSIAFFLIGFTDDKINLKPNLKIFFFILSIFFLIFIDEELNIQIIYLSVIENKFSIGSLSYFWTVLCFLLFINALNMFDGINLQVGIYSLFLFIYLILFHDYLNNFLLIVCFSLICFSFLNFFSKSFLGNSGSYLLGFLIGYIYIKTYNLEGNIFADEIVLLMIIPGLDLIRLFFMRLFKKKHPFSPDRGHIHHYFLKKYNNIQTFLIISLIIWLPVIIAKFTGLIFLVLIFQFFIYSFFIFRLKS